MNFYVTNSRMIILTVVQINNDIVNQNIIQKSQCVNKADQRTVEIIIKSDLINTDTEKCITLLTKNQDTIKLKLRYFLMKNLTLTELINEISLKQRQKSEIQYFQFSSWKKQALSMNWVNIITFQSYLQTLLDQHIEWKLSKICEKIQNLMMKMKQEMIALSEKRLMIKHLQMFHFCLMMWFHSLITSALNSTYYEMNLSFFSESDRDIHSIRLHALMYHWNTTFSDYMRNNEQKRRIITLRSTNNAELKEISEEILKKNQILVTESEMKT